MKETPKMRIKLGFSSVSPGEPVVVHVRFSLIYFPETEKFSVDVTHLCEGKDKFNEVKDLKSI